MFRSDALRGCPSTTSRLSSGACASSCLPNACTMKAQGDEAREKIEGKGKGAGATSLLLGRLLFGLFGRLCGALVRDQVHEVTAFEHARMSLRVAQIGDFSHSGVLFPGERLLLSFKFNLCASWWRKLSRTRDRFLSVSKFCRFPRPSRT